MAQEVSRRDFLARLGVTVSAAAAGATAGAVPLLGGKAEAQPKGNIPDTPYKIGHMTFFTGAAAVLGEPSYKGHILAAEEINSHGGLLGKRKIETIKADEAAGTDANVKEMRRMKLSEKIDHIHPDYSYGRNAFDHFNIVMKKMIPGAQVVSEGWPKLGTTDFTSHITKAISAKPDLLVSSVWGGD